MMDRERVGTRAHPPDGVLVAGVVAVFAVAAGVAVEGHLAFVSLARMVARSILEGPWWIHIAP